MPLYVVSKDGILCSIVIGIFSSRAVAKIKAQEYANQDRDDYHEYAVRRYNLDKPREFKNGRVDVPNPILTWRKVK